MKSQLCIIIGEKLDNYDLALHSSPVPADVICLTGKRPHIRNDAGTK